MIYYSWDGDHIGRLAGQTKLNNDIEGTRKIGRAIEDGNKLFIDFAINNGGSPIQSGGDEGAATIPADKLPELMPVTAQYHQITGCTVTIGIGFDLASSSKAVLIGKVYGKGDCAVVWQPEMEKLIDELIANPISEKDKEVEAYLGHDDTDHLGKADPADIQRRLQPTVPHGHAPITLPEVKLDAPQQDPAAEPQKPNYEDEFHGHAQKQAAKDLHDKTHSQENLQQLKQSVVETLQNVRTQLPVIAQLKQTSPDAYNSVVELIQGVIELGKETMVMPKVKKSEDLSKAISKLEPGKRLAAKLEPHPRAQGANVFTRTFDYSHLLPPDVKNSGFQLHIEHKNTMLPKGVKEIPTSNTSSVVAPVRPTEMIRSVIKSPTGQEVGQVTGHIRSKFDQKVIEPHSELDAPYRGKGLGTAMYEAAYTHAKSTGVNRVEGGVHSPDAHALHTRLAKKHGFHYRSKREAGVTDDYFPYKPYSYALKSEVFHENEDGFLGPGHGPIFYRDGEIEKDELDAQLGPNEGAKRRMGANSGGAQAGRRHLNLPVGTFLDGKVKIINGVTGLANWRSVKDGAIASQQHNPPILGANSSPTSASNPDR